MRKTIIPPSPVGLGDVIIAVNVEPQPPRYGLLIRDGMGVIEAPNGEVHSRIKLPYPLNVPLVVRERWYVGGYWQRAQLNESVSYPEDEPWFWEMCKALHPYNDAYAWLKRSPATMPSHLARYTITFHSVDAMQYKDRPEGTISKPMQPDEWAFVYRGIVTLINKNI